MFSIEMTFGSNIQIIVETTSLKWPRALAFEKKLQIVAIEIK
jgi:hypothetical protein